MRRKYFLSNKLIGLFLLGFVLTGCGAAQNYKAYEGETKKTDELAVIKGESRTQERYLDKYYSITDQIWVHIVAVDDEDTSWMFSRMPQGVLVEPGRRYVVVRYNNGQAYAFGRLWLDAEAGKTYIVKTRIKNYSIIFWAEDEKTGETVGGYPGTEPEKNNVAPSEA